MSGDSRVWNDGYEQGQKAAAAEIERLRADVEVQANEIDRICKLWLADKERLTGVADFLDGLAKRMWVRGEQQSAEECRAWAERLRK